MSFSTEVKNELCRVSMQRACCTRAEVYGALLHASVFSHKEIRLSAENMTVVRRLQALLQRAFFVECEPQKAGRKQQLVLTEPAQIGRVFDALGYDCKSHITYHINRNLLEEDCCIASFLRGAFLMGGTVAGPDKKSHLELKTTHQSLSGEETSLMLDLGLSPKQARRGSAYLLYFKDGASAEDFLTRIGAPHAAMELMNVELDVAAHRAVNDAECTAALLPIVDRAVTALASERRMQLEHILEKESRIAASALRSLPTPYMFQTDALADQRLMSLPCPACGKRTAFDTPWFDGGRERYLAISVCPQHGFVYGQMHFKRTSANTLIMHQRAYPASREDVEDVRERYRLYLLTPPKKRHHRLNMEEIVEKAEKARE